MRVRAAWYSSAQMQLKDYIPSGIWDLVDARGSLHVDDGRQRAQVIYELLLRRKTLFYTVPPRRTLTHYTVHLLLYSYVRIRFVIA